MTLFIVITILFLIAAACCLIPAVRRKIAALFVTEQVQNAEAVVDNICKMATARGITEIGKYVLRFGIVLVIILPIAWFLMGPQAVKTVLYKVCLVSAAIGLAELLWLTFFKPTFGKTEDLNEKDKRTVLIFRGILYAAIVLSFTLGL